MIFDRETLEEEVKNLMQDTEFLQVMIHSSQ